ncbi:hypothetical protein [Halopiger djelfimassiliensis]|uniref:hypothetical protein n=1 Tax=Halopiger djelfimassiliensis TaxID=1293047 RepID=UPI0012B6414E|nr:hypothetical protein [Halopiger djelfimassiliensis]
MSEDSKRPGSVDVTFWSIIGALFGGFIGSLASTAFADSAVSNFASTLFVFLTGIFIGLLMGVAFHDGIRNTYSANWARRAEWTGKGAIAAIGVIISCVGVFIAGISFRGLASDPNVGMILGALVILLGVLIAIVPFADHIEMISNR